MAAAMARPASKWSPGPPWGVNLAVSATLPQAPSPVPARRRRAPFPHPLGGPSGDKFPLPHPSPRRWFPVSAGPPGLSFSAGHRGGRCPWCTRRTRHVPTSSGVGRVRCRLVPTGGGFRRVGCRRFRPSGRDPMGRWRWPDGIPVWAVSNPADPQSSSRMFVDIVKKTLHQALPTRANSTGICMFRHRLSNAMVDNVWNMMAYARV